MPSQSSPGLRFLVVENNPRVRTVILEMLKIIGHEGSGLGTCKAVLPGLRTAGADVLMTEVHLPDGSGIDQAKEAAALFQGLKVIFLTEFENQVSERLGFPFACLPKPFYITDLRYAIRRVTGTRSE
jgi:DNA-binding response OmpR family regulator